MKQLAYLCILILLGSCSKVFEQVQTPSIADAAGTGPQLTVTWIGNTFGDNANHVGNCARSLWVSPGGIVYAASGWDENGRNIGIYQGGTIVGSMGGNKESQGSAISGDSTWIFTAQETPNAGKIGRYNRATKTRDLLFTASSGTGDAIRGIGLLNSSVYVSDMPGNRIAVFTAGGTLLRQWTVASPGSLAVDNTGSIWVAQPETALISQYDTLGNQLATIQMDVKSRPTALFVDHKHQQLLVGDQGPDLNIKIYDLNGGQPALSSTFGVAGGYLDPTTGTRGQTGDKRFTRIVGIGKDNADNLYVLNNPWGGGWDLGRNGATDIHCYSAAGTLLWTLQQLNFEGNAAVDPASDGTEFYSGNILYSYNGSGGANYKANTIDPFRYPGDARIQVSDPSRGEHFGQVANVNGHRILIANNQNADVFYSYYFNPATDGYIAIPGDTIIARARIRNGFDMDSLGGLWTSLDKTLAIQHYPLTGFAANGKPIWGAAASTPVPASIVPLNRLMYLSGSDKMILAGGSPDWTVIGDTVQVYNNWLGGNRTPNLTITLSRARAKSMAAAGDYIFVGYYAIPDIDVFDSNTGTLTTTFTAASAGSVYVGNDVDSQYGIKAFKTTKGEYIVTKDDYNASKIVVYHWKP